MRKILLLLLLAGILAGCKTHALPTPDTIVDIPLHPTEPTIVTSPPTEAPTEATEAATEATIAETAPPATEKASVSSGKPSGSGNKTNSKPSSGQSKDPTKPKETQAPTEAPTEPITQPPTEPPTEKPTEKPTEAPTEKPTEKPTEPPTQPPTEKPTEVPTEPATEPVTEPVAHPAEDTMDDYISTNLELDIISAVNACRTEAGLPPLETEPKLCAIAALRAGECARSWSHTRPDGSGFETILTEYDFPCTASAESLYFTYGVPSAEAIVDKWISSEEHSRSILDENNARIGVGTYATDDGLIYVAALFVD